MSMVAARMAAIISSTGDAVWVLKELLHEVVVIICDGLDELLSVLIHRVDQVSRNVNDLVCHSLRIVVPDDRLHGE